LELGLNVEKKLRVKSVECEIVERDLVEKRLEIGEESGGLL
jgi:hypothetical protein